MFRCVHGWLILVLVAGSAVLAADIPPSPSTAPGKRIWPAPAITHWPAVIYADEQRNVAFGLPVRNPGAPGTIGWRGQAALPFRLPETLEHISGLLALPPAPGSYTAELTINGEPQTGALQVRLVDAAGPWPQTALREGFPVDAEGVPVILVDRRRDANDERRWALLTTLSKPRPAGQPLMIGDTFAALGDSAFTGVPVRVVEALDLTQPWHAQVVGFARESATWGEQPLATAPRTIMWSPGNRALQANTWSEEEERFFGLVRTRCTALGIFPRLVLILPPDPIDDRAPVMRQAALRRDHLRRAAASLGWIVFDVARYAGTSESANRVADNVFAPGPIGAARERLRAALATESAR